MARRVLPQLIAGLLRPTDGADVAPIVVGSAPWFAWLAEPANSAFSVVTPAGALTVRREQKGGSSFWYAYRRNGPRLRKAYLGKAAELSLARLSQAIERLAAPEATAVREAAPAELRLLGAPLLLRGAPVVLSSAKAVALLGYLALAEAPQSREQLLALFWPESAPDAARKNLRNTLWAIRAALGDDVLLRAGARLGLAPAVRLDLRDFLAAAAQPAETAQAALQTALELYRGPLLDGLSLLDAPDWELWLTAERERLLQRFLVAADVLLERRRAAGDWPALAQTATQALAHDPLHEPAHRALMEAQARRGDRAGALRQYERLRAVLDQELGVTPDAESEALHDAIVGSVLTAATPARAALPPPPRPAPPPSQPFVGREEELAALNAEWALAAAGRARLVVLSGELGIGKSRLWQEWVATLPAPSVLEIQSLEATQSLPFAPLVAVFSNAAWSARVAAAVGANLPPWLHELARLLPGLQELLPRPILGGMPDEERQRLFEAFVQAVLAVTAPPHLLFVDDLHWADGATLDWLDYAIHRLGDTPLLLVASYRPEDARPDLLRRVAQWERSRPVRRLALPRLTPDEAAALLDRLGVSGAGQEARLAHESAGNPYFLRELALSRTQGVPPALADLVRARVEALPEPARQVLQAAAVLEPDIEGTTLVQISALDEEATLEALDSLLASGMVVEQDERYAFSHPLVATLVRGAMHRVRRATLHRRAATALAQIYANHLPARAGRIAAHYREASDRRQAAFFATMAGEYALSVTAVAEAVQLYRQALADETSPERLLDLGRALVWYGDQDEAQARIQQAYEQFAAGDDQRGMARASLALADLLLTRGGYAEAGRIARRVLDLPGERDPFSAAGAHLLIGTAARAQGDLAAAQQHIDLSLSIAQQHRITEVQMYAAVSLSNIRAEQGDLAGALAAARATVALARQVGNSYYEVVGLNNAAYRATLLGEYEAAHEHIAAGMALAHARGLKMPLQWLYGTRGELAIAEGAWDDAELWLTRARAEALRHNNHGQVAIIDANLGRAAQGRGDLERAADLLIQGWQGSAATAAQHQHVQIGLWLAALYSSQGDRERARATWAAATAGLAEGVETPLRAEIEQVRREIERA